MSFFENSPKRNKKVNKFKRILLIIVAKYKLTNVKVKLRTRSELEVKYKWYRSEV